MNSVLLAKPKSPDTRSIWDRRPSSSFNVIILIVYLIDIQKAYYKSAKSVI